jgi:type I thyroxine 5'-deiodinase
MAYTGWPDRLHLIERGGRIAFKSKPGPFGFHPEDLAAVLKSDTHLSVDATQASSR